jgi:hypothetical protein
MKLHATMTPYSGTVGGGLNLIDENGKLRFIVTIFGIKLGTKSVSLTKEETAAIAGALIRGIPDGIEVAERA